MMLVVDCTITMMMIASLLTNVDCTTWARGSRESRRCSELGPGTGTSKQASNGLHTPTTPLPPIIPTPSLRVFLYFELVLPGNAKHWETLGQDPLLAFMDRFGQLWTNVTLQGLLFCVRGFLWVHHWHMIINELQYSYWLHIMMTLKVNRSIENYCYFWVAADATVWRNSTQNFAHHSMVA